jgi:hypothetical protein
LVLALLAALGAPGTALAMFARMTDEQLLAASDLIALGVWIGPLAAPADLAAAVRAGGLQLCGIDVSEVLKGPGSAPGRAPGTAQRVLVGTPGSDLPRSGSDIRHQPGERGLWLLRLKPGGPAGLYLADHPQRFEADASRIADLRRLLAAP